MSGGAVRPTVTTRAAAGKTATPSGAIATGSAAGAPNPGPKKM
jgi:hypothetical protein